MPNVVPFVTPFNCVMMIPFKYAKALEALCGGRYIKRGDINCALSIGGYFGKW